MVMIDRYAMPVPVDAAPAVQGMERRIAELESELRTRPSWSDVPVWRACYQVMESGREYTLAEIVTALQGLGVMVGYYQPNAGSAARSAMMHRPEVFRRRREGSRYRWSLTPGAGWAVQS